MAYQVYRGLFASIPPLKDGQLGFTTDTHAIYVGLSGTNYLIGPGSSNVDIYAGTGITCSPNPITGSGTVSLIIPVIVADGGTGDTSFTAYTPICGNNTSGLQSVIAGSSGQVLISQGTSGIPVFVTLNTGSSGVAIYGSTFITCVPNPITGSGTISLNTLTSGIYGSGSVTSGTLSSGAFDILPGEGIAVTQTNNNTFTISSLVASKQEVQCATTGILPGTYIYNNGTSGVGATLTSPSPAILVIDTYNVQLGDRVLVKYEASGAHNGIYNVTTLGTGLIDSVFTRTTDFDSASDGINGAFVFVQQGAVNGSTGWLCSTYGDITFGTTAINWLQYAGAGTYVGQSPISVTSGTISLNTLTSGTLGSGAFGILAGNGITVTQTNGNTFTITNASGAGITIPLIVADGGTGDTSFTAYTPICGGTNATSGLQSVASIGNSGQVLVSYGTGNLPVFANVGGGGGGTGTVTNVTGVSGLTGTVTNSGLIEISIPILIGTGGTGVQTFTPFTPVCGGTNATSGLQSVAATGNSGQVLISQGSGNLPSFGNNAIPGYVYGLNLSWSINNIAISVGTGYATDVSGQTILSLASAVNTSVTSGNGCDSQALAGTCFTVSGSSLVSGSITAFLTGFCPTGTPRSIGTCVSGNTTYLSGTSTSWFSNCAVGDLVGNSTIGYSAIAAIVSNAQITLYSGYPLSVSNSTSLQLIENPTFCIGGLSGTPLPRQVKAIASNSALTLTSTMGVSTSGVGIAGIPSPLGQIPCHVWIGNGTNGTTVFNSTQRTIPFLSGTANGYTSYYRRIGSFIASSGAIVPFAQTGHGVERTYLFQDSYNGNGEVFVNNGSATSWTTASVATLCPPTTSMLMITAVPIVSPNASYANMVVSVRPQGLGSSTASRNQYVGLSQYSAQGPQEYIGAPLMCPPLGGAIDYVCWDVLNTYTVDLIAYGYTESL